MSEHLINLYGFGKVLYTLGRKREAEVVLWQGARQGGERGEASAIFLSRVYGRTYDRGLHKELLDLAGHSSAAEIERAKYYEHVLRDYEKALDCVLKAQYLPGSPSCQTSLQNRRRRLEVKLRRRGEYCGGSPQADRRLH